MKKCGAFCFIIRQKTGEYGKNPINCIGSFMLRAKRRMNPGMRLLLKYIYCIETPFCEKDAMFYEKEKEKEKVK